MPALFLTDICAAIGPCTWSSSCVCSGRQLGFFRFASDWPVVGVDVTALPADRSEKPVWREELDRRERPGREPRGAASSAGWDRPTGYSDWTVFYISFFFCCLCFRGLNVNTGVHETHKATVLSGWTCGLRVSSKPLELSEKKKIDWELRCGWGFLWGSCTERCYKNRLFILESGQPGLRLSYVPMALKIQSFSSRKILHNKCIAILMCAPFGLNPSQ